MKSINKIFFFLMITSSLFLAASCRDMLDTTSDRVAFSDDNQIKNPDDLFYSITGILAQVQKLGDRYVLFGELRGDLMNVSANASESLQEIGNFQATTDNDWANKYDYYNVINNCNYALQKTDTSLVDQNEKVMMPGFAEIKTIRAWVYFQMAQVFGKVTYLDVPVLSLETSLQKYPTLTLDQLVDVLITDLEPYAGVELPSSSQSPNSFIPVQLMLGDLYLYRNEYVKAANMYHSYISMHSVIISSDYISKWNATTFDDVSTGHRESYLNEAISSIVYSSDPRDLHSSLVGLTFNDKAALLPAQSFVDSMTLAPYFYSDKLGNAITATNEGDLRGRISLAKKGIQYGDAYSVENITGTGTQPLIYKFYYKATESTAGSDPNNNLIQDKLVYATKIPVYRIPQLYLRYAEAINRAGKPSMAFAVLKYGLTKSNLANAAMVNPSERSNSESYIDFQNTAFDQNIPMAARGRGLGIQKDTKVFVIPDYTRYTTGQDGKPTPSTDPSDIAAAHQDSINWVEVRLLDEMAAETSFEGNRFFDLLRISRRRPNHPEFMAEKVAAKYNNAEAMKAKLMSIDAWFVK